MTPATRNIVMAVTLAAACGIAFVWRSSAPPNLQAILSGHAMPAALPNGPWRNKPLQYHQGWHVFTRERLAELAGTYPSRNMTAFITEVRAAAGNHPFLIYNDPLAIAFIADRQGGGTFHFLNFCGVSPSGDPLGIQLQQNLIGFSPKATTRGFTISSMGITSVSMITLRDHSAMEKVTLIGPTGNEQELFDLRFPVYRRRGEPCQARLPLGLVPFIWAVNQDTGKSVVQQRPSGAQKRIAQP